MSLKSTFLALKKKWYKLSKFGGGRGEVISTKSKRTPTFFRETFPYIIKESNSPETHISLELNITSLGPNRHKQNYISPIVWPKIPFYTYILSRHPCLESSNRIVELFEMLIQIVLTFIASETNFVHLTSKWKKINTFTHKLVIFWHVRDSNLQTQI